MSELKYLQRLLFLLAMAFSLSFACVACGDDEEEELFDDPNQEQTDNGGGGSQDGGTAPTDSIMPPAEDPSLPTDSIPQTDDPSLPTDSIAGGEDEPMVPADSILVSDSHEAVDLGLPSGLKWATCNVGASSPEEYGYYFSWGETKTKSNYTNGNSTTEGLSFSRLYSRGIIGSDCNLTPAYDAATANWGSKWRMPTLDEIKELLNNCTWEWTTQSGVKGRKVTGPNGTSLFLPAAGYRYGTYLNVADSYGYYWSATPDSYSDGACYLLFSLDGCNWGKYDRYYGRSVRPVSDELLSDSEK